MRDLKKSPYGENPYMTPEGQRLLNSDGCHEKGMFFCPFCSWQWESFELPVASSWNPAQSPIVCCDHPDAGSKVLQMYRRSAMLKDGVYQRGRAVAMTVGGIYRRRACLAKSCGARWTTYEIRADKSFKEITDCPRCAEGALGGKRTQPAKGKPPKNWKGPWP